MELALIIWAISAFDNLSTAIAIVSILLATAAFFFMVFTWKSKAIYSDLADDVPLNKALMKSTVRRITFAAVLLMASVMMPSERTAWYMVAGYTAQSVYQSEVSQDLRQIAAAKVKLYAQEQLQELKEQGIEAVQAAASAAK